MERFTRTYLQYNQYDQDGRSYEWRDFENQNMTFEEAMAWLKKNYCGFYTKVRLIEKEFDPEAFEIVTHWLRYAEGDWNKVDGVTVTEIGD